MIFTILSFTGAVYLIFTICDFVYSLFRRHANHHNQQEVISDCPAAAVIETISDQLTDKIDHYCKADLNQQSQLEVDYCEESSDSSKKKILVGPTVSRSTKISSSSSDFLSPAKTDTQDSSPSTIRQRRQQRRFEIELTRSKTDSDSSDDQKRIQIVREKPSYKNFRRRNKRTQSTDQPRVLIKDLDGEDQISSQIAAYLNLNTGYTGSTEFRNFFVTPPDSLSRSVFEATSIHSHNNMPMIDFLRSSSPADEKSLSQVHWEINKLAQTAAPQALRYTYC